MRASDRHREFPLRGWLPLLIPAAIYIVVIAVVVGVRTYDIDTSHDYDTIRAHSTSDFRDFWFTARNFRETGKITTDYGVHNYLPFFTVFMTPWSLAPLWISAIAFSVLSLLLFGTAVALAENLLHDRFGPRPRAALIAAILLMLPYVHACAVLGNVGLILAFLVVATWFLVERGREWEAGVALGLAILIKLLPIVLLVYFVFKRRWRVVAAGSALVIVLGWGIPWLALGWNTNVTQHAQFVERALGDHSAYHTLTADQPPKAFYANNALPMVLRRLFTPLNAGRDAQHRDFQVTLADLPRPAVLTLYGVLAAVLGAASITAALRRSRPWPPPDVIDGRAVRAQFGLWCILMLLAAPLLWIHYFPLAYWAVALLADAAFRRRRANQPAWPEWAIIAVWCAGLACLASPHARAAGAQLIPFLALWGLLLWRSTEKAPSVPKPPRIVH